MAESSPEQKHVGVSIPLVVTGFGIGWLAGLSVSPVANVLISSLTGGVIAILLVLSGVKQPDENENAKGSNRATSLRQINAWPAAVLVMGIWLGTVAGIWVRAHDLLSPPAPESPTIVEEADEWVKAGLTDRTEVARRLFESRYTYRGWLGPDLAAEVQKWTDAGLAEEVVVQRLFESTYPLESMAGGAATAPIITERQDHQRSVLYNSISESCDGLQVFLRDPLPEGDEEYVADFIKKVEVSPFDKLLESVPDREMLRLVLVDVCRVMKDAQE